MKNLILFVIIVMQIISAGCVSKTRPEINDLQKLDKDEIKLLLLGNTLTYTGVWGRWAEYHRKDYVGFSGTWEDLFDYYGWEGEEATSSFEISDDAEICWRYSGDSQWANPEYNYCSLIYADEGMYYIINTENPRDSKLVGVLREIKIKQGDYYDLSNGLEIQRGVQELRKEK